MTTDTAVVISIDSAYVRPACTMLRSLAANTTLDRVAVRVVHNDLDEQAIDTLRQQRPDVLTIEPVEVEGPDLTVDARSHISDATYRKLAAARACREFERLLIIDVDLVVLGDIRELYDVDLGGKTLAAVQDAFNPWLTSPFAFPASAGAEEKYAGLPYFNSGVMVVDVQKWISSRTDERAAEFARDPARVKIWEQDALNGVLIGEWTALDPRWNCFPISELARHDRVRNMLATHGMGLRELRAREAQAKILHFVGRDKPWLDTYPESPNKKLYSSF
ncbi:glycosyltransferase family 8 protein [Streptomyces sp. NL15-2K]|uniref:glycosyltransferase family 8 protein n=1 Tax=Streptomyces sp. NL15-2K TaxID=376149 RepID=UPI000F5872F4|nr:MULTISPECIES: glycosyltransferase family 8 protein [Actinomycetes]WKX11330.1 glycosyltransferase family 8 protein [Kutzneria buriramensis]GCB47262.1 general stress protein A [Streptomyces sp. NL15-2K]